LGSPFLLALMVAGGAMVGSLFAADAWNNVTFTAGEVKEPRRTLPISLTVGTGLVITLYLLANLAYMAVVPLQGDAELAEQLKREKIEADEHGTDADRERVEQRYAEATFQLGISHARDDRVGTAVLELASLRFAPRLGVYLMAIAIMISTFG